MSRPYLSYGIAELETLARESQDPDVLQALRSELEHRQVPRARRLLEALSQSDSPQPEPRREREASPGTRRRKAKPAEQRVPGGPGPPEDLVQRYEALRLTFTVEGELLARWGMTSAMPLELQDLVFAAWAERLATGPEDGLRTKQKLQSDRERLAAERGLHDAVGALPWLRRSWPNMSAGTQRMRSEA